MRRRFSLRQRRWLWAESGGLCALCGQDLGQDWEADHVVPWSKGGKTEIDNAQALCRVCNRTKGDQMTTTKTFPTLRGWQDVAVTQTLGVLRSAPTGWEYGYLCVATPGAGKTHYASAVARELIDRGEIDRVVVVVPTLGVRKSWVDTAHDWGVELNTSWAEKRDRQLPSSYDGIVVTYQGIAMAADRAIAAYVGDGRTLLVCDEIHHAGDGLDWGDKLRAIGDLARHRVVLSGTPFRNDNKTIPYVRYENGRSVPDYVFDYARALDEHCVRYITFPAQDGRVEWERFGEVVSLESFEDEVPEAEARTRLRMALNPRGEWLPTVLRNADERLRSLREGSDDQVAVPDSAGIVTCIDIDHARAVAKILRQVTGEEPVVVASDDPSSLEAIERFKTSRDRWLVSVRMVSEGVDIQRARVLVYATNVISWLYFQQFAGRAVRVRTTLFDGQRTRKPNDKESVPDCDAVMFIPADKTLVSYAQEFSRLRDHVLEPDKDPGGGIWPPIEQQQFLPPTFLGALATEQDVVLISGVRVPQRYVAEAGTMLAGKGSQHLVEQVAAGLYQRDIASGLIQASAPMVVAPVVDDRPLQYRHQDARDRRNTVVKKLVREFAKDIGVGWNTPEYEELAKRVNGTFKSRYGGKKASALEIEELQQQAQEALDAIAEVNMSRDHGTAREYIEQWLRQMGGVRNGRR